MRELGRADDEVHAHAVLVVVCGEYGRRVQMQGPLGGGLPLHHGMWRHLCFAGLRPMGRTGLAQVSMIALRLVINKAELSL